MTPGDGKAGDILAEEIVTAIEYLEEAWYQSGSSTPGWSGFRVRSTLSGAKSLVDDLILDVSGEVK